MHRRSHSQHRKDLWKLIGHVAVHSGVIAGIIVIASLTVGILGYHYVVRLSWIDALLNASMILTGMGPVNRVEGIAGKVFASGYALFSGIAFLAIITTLVEDGVHHLQHRGSTTPTA